MITRYYIQNLVINRNGKDLSRLLSADIKTQGPFFPFPLCPETDLGDTHPAATSFRTSFLDNGHFLFDCMCVCVCVCLGGWVQESHVVENVAALRPWQELPGDKYRVK